mgnify:CR=1 FL=1
MTERVLTLRELNRTSLQRQMLIERQEVSVTEAVDKLIGLQSQIPNPPYIGLWTRLKNFSKDDLTHTIENRKIVRAAMMRSTLHLMTTEVYGKIQKTIQPALEKGFRSFFGKHVADVDVEKLVAAAKPFLEEAPRSMGELREFLLTIQPDVDPAALSYAIRTYLPLVQVPPSGTWGVGTRASYIPADMWLDEPQDADAIGVFKLYLAGYGPASIMDFQAFTGLTSLSKTINAAKDEFTLYRNEDGKELFDLPELDIISGDTPVPVTFLPEYENALISYKDRNRILPDEHRKKVFLTAGRVASTVLVDGFVAGTWKSDRDKDTATLRIDLFEDASSTIKDKIVDEAQHLLQFIEEDVENYYIVFEWCYNFHR